MRASIVVCLAVSVLLQVADAFVYTCNEVKNNLIPTGRQIATPYACIVGELRVTTNVNDMSYSKFVKSTFLKDADGMSHRFYDVMNDTCVEGKAPWTVIVNPGTELDCKDEITVMFTSRKPHIVGARDLSEFLDTKNDDYVTIVSPVGAIQFKYESSIPVNSQSEFTFYTGIGNGEAEEMHYLFKKTLSYGEMVYHYGPVMTVQLPQGIDYQFGVAGTNNAGEMNTADNKVTLVSSGVANDRQSLSGRNFHSLFDFGALAVVNISGRATIDASTKTNLKFTCYPYMDTTIQNILEIKSSQTVSKSMECLALEIDYNGRVADTKIGRSNEMILVDMTTAGFDEGWTTAKPSTTTKSTRVLAYFIPSVLVLLSALLL